MKFGPIVVRGEVMASSRNDKGAHSVCPYGFVITSHLRTHEPTSGFSSVGRWFEIEPIFRYSGRGRLVEGNRKERRINGKAILAITLGLRNDEGNILHCHRLWVSSRWYIMSDWGA